MNFLSLIRVNIKKIIKTPIHLLFFLLLPLGTILFTTVIIDGMDSVGGFSASEVVFNSDDRGTFGESFLAPFADSQEVFEDDLDGALHLLERNKVLAVYNIPSDFTKRIQADEKPVIEVYKREEGNLTVTLEARLETALNRLLEERILLDNGVINAIDELDVLQTEIIVERDAEVLSNDFNVGIMLLIMFVFYGSVSMVSELNEYRKARVLARAISTPNWGGTILASLIIAFFLVQFGINAVVLVCGKLILGMSITNFPVVMVNLALASLFSITFSLAIVRLIKNESVVSIITAISALGSSYLAIFTDVKIFPHATKWLVNLAKFVPQYWVFESVEEGVLFPHVFILLLMIVALFSAGCYKLRGFVNE
ncbi:MAG TPA: ABC transporter permease [Natronincola sp.]|nr:ABC transporter permease [Natronincola sp.]